MPRFRDGFPRPSKEYHHGVWRIIWRWADKKYSVATTLADKNDIAGIEQLVRVLASQLASTTRPDISEPWSLMPGIERYLTDRF